MKEKIETSTYSSQTKKMKMEIFVGVEEEVVIVGRACGAPSSFFMGQVNPPIDGQVKIPLPARHPAEHLLILVSPSFIRHDLLESLFLDS